MASPGKITIRVRHAAGTLRLEQLDPHTTTIEALQNEVRRSLGLSSSSASSPPIVLYNAPPSQPSAVSFVDDSLTLEQAGLQHGSMLFVDHKLLPPTTTSAQAPSTGKTIDPQGNLVASSASASTSSEYRPGLLSLRDQKLHWTLTEMTELDQAYTFVIKGKEPNFCSQVSVDLDSAQDFQRFFQLSSKSSSSASSQVQCALMMGRFEDNADVVAAEEAAAKARAAAAASSTAVYGRTKAQMRVRDLKTDEQDQLEARQRVEVECLYYPAMLSAYRVDFDGEGTQTALRIADALGLRCVGIIFSHAPRKCTFDSSEVLLCGEACLEAMQGQTDSPFVICKVCASAEDGTVQMDAFQLTKTCLEMQREEALLSMLGVVEGVCAVDAKFTVMIEAKPSEVVDCDYFIKRVPIKSHSSQLVRVRFPKENRQDGKHNASTARSLLPRSGVSGRAWAEALGDFHLLVFLAGALGVETVQEIAREVLMRKTGEAMVEDDFPEGFALMVREAVGS